MSLLKMPSMIFSSSGGWDELIRVPPTIARTFLRLVLPLSLLPAAMIYYAGGHHGDVFIPGVSAAQWRAAAELFLVAELLTVPAMAWLIHLASRVNGVPARYRDCFTVAAIAPVPLWVSALVLFIPSAAVVAVVGVLALACSLALTYRGVYTLLRMREDLRAMQMATVLTGAGLLAWLVLMQIVLVH